MLSVTASIGHIHCRNCHVVNKKVKGGLHGVQRWCHANIELRVHNGVFVPIMMAWNIYYIPIFRP